MCIRDRPSTVHSIANGVTALLILSIKGNSCPCTNALEDITVPSLIVGAVSYTHLDVYKRQM